MRSPYQNQFSHTLRRGRALDVFAPGKASALTVSRDTRPVPAYRPAGPGKRGLDGAYREKRALLAELQEQPFRDVFWRSVRKAELYFRRFRRIMSRFIPNIAPHKMLYGYLTAGVVFGIVSMGFIEHFFGPGVFARSDDAGQVAGATTVMAEPETAPASTEAAETDMPYDSGSDIFLEYFNETADEQYREAARAMVKGYPIEEMLPYIFEQDRLTAAFLIGIAKKESNWGKRVPVLNDQDCFNYWGYRGIRRMMGTGGHTCFNSRKDAVETVAKRLNTLINSQQLNTPEKMIIWKCGFSCNGHSRESVKKWISDVDMYFKQLSDE